MQQGAREQLKARALLSKLRHIPHRGIREQLTVAYSATLYAWSSCTPIDVSEKTTLVAVWLSLWVFSVPCVLLRRPLRRFALLSFPRVSFVLICLELCKSCGETNIVIGGHILVLLATCYNRQLQSWDWSWPVWNRFQSPDGQPATAFERPFVWPGGSIGRRSVLVCKVLLLVLIVCARWHQQSPWKLVIFSMEMMVRRVTVFESCWPMRCGVAADCSLLD